MADTDRTRVADWLHDDYVELQTDPTFVAEQLILDIMVKIGAVMEEEDITQKDLADALDISASAMSQLLSGDQNVSIKRLVKVALALGMQWETPKLVPFEANDIERVETRTRINVAELEVDRSANEFPNKSTDWGLSIGGEPMDENENDEEQSIAA
jgi:transcriptional regulator with XRE-family HTH domain